MLAIDILTIFPYYSHIGNTHECIYFISNPILYFLYYIMVLTLIYYGIILLYNTTWYLLYTVLSSPSVFAFVATYSTVSGITHVLVMYARHFSCCHPGFLIMIDRILFSPIMWSSVISSRLWFS